MVEPTRKCIRFQRVIQAVAVPSSTVPTPVHSMSYAASRPMILELEQPASIADGLDDSHGCSSCTVFTPRAFEPRIDFYILS